MGILTVYDPTMTDELGRVRGGGRFSATLKENLGDSTRFVTKVEQISQDDIVLVPSWQPYKPPLLSKPLGKKHIIVIFDVIPLKYPEVFPTGLKGRWWLYKNLKSLSMYDHVITISEFAKNDIVDYLSLEPQDVSVVYPTTSSMYFKPSKKKLPKIVDVKKSFTIPKDYLLYVGDTNWNKNLVNMAQAVIEADIPIVCVGKAFNEVKKIREMDHGEQLQILGTSPKLNHMEQREFKEFIKMTLHDERFIFPGYIDDATLKVLYKNTLSNILYSRDEGFGLSYLEASSQKAPSILADTGIFREIAGAAALYADPEKPSDLAKQIKLLKKNAKKREALKNKAYTRSKKYSPEAFVHAMNKVLSTV